MRKTYLLVLLIAAVILGCKTRSEPDPGSVPPFSLKNRFGHIFIIVLENENYATSFDPHGAAPYLATTLPSMGQLLRQYYGIGHVSLDNYIAMASGQAPNAETQSDCMTTFSDWSGTTTPDANGQVTGQGCVYPPAILTIGNQMQTVGLTWREYAEDMGNDLARDGSKTCSHPVIGTQDGTQSATATDQYATRHNPFMYFHAIIDDQANCDAHVVALPALASDLGSVATTPNYAFITPNLCNDGHDTNCKNGDAGGLAQIDVFLRKWVPMITSSPAFQQDGLLIVTFDEAEVGVDATSCCNEPTGPNTTSPGVTGPGGGRVGAVLISGQITPGSVNDTPYNHYSMLRSVEDNFGLPYLGYAGMAGLQAFGPDVFVQH